MANRLIVEIGGDASSLRKEIAGLPGVTKASFGKMNTEATGGLNSFSAILKNFGAGLSVGFLVGLTKGVIDSIGKLQDLSDRLGVSTDALQSFDYAAKLVGVSSQETAKMWDVARKSVDNLMAGTEAQVKSFQKLGLTQKDLAGLTLDQSVEKIAKAYSAAKDQAGAYDAVTDILGSKSSPKLMVALEQLASQGFAGLSREASAAGQVLDGEFIQAVDRAGDRLTTIWSAVKNGLGSIVGAVVIAAESVGKFAGGVVYGADAMTDAFAKPETAVNGLVNKIEKATEKVVILMATTGQLAGLEEFRFRQSLEDLSVKEKIEQLELRRLKYAMEAINAGLESAEGVEKILKSEQLLAEINKLEKAEKKETAAAQNEITSEADKQAKTAAKNLPVEIATTEAVVERVTVEKVETANLRTNLDLTMQRLSAEKLILSVKNSGGTSNDQLSDRDLAVKVENARRNTSVARNSASYSAFGHDDGGLFFAETKQREVEAEANLRRNFRTAYSQQGEGAFNNQQFRQFEESRLRNYIRPEDERQNANNAKNIQEIADFITGRKTG